MGGKPACSFIKVGCTVGESEENWNKTKELSLTQWMSSVSTVDGEGKYKKNMKTWILIFRFNLG